MNSQDLLTSRFFRTSDYANRQFVFNMPEEWWSRKYEYQWAGQFADPDAVALDAACGIEHPLKYYLADECKKCFACDYDPRLADLDDVRDSTIRGYHIEPSTSFPDRYIDDIDYQVASLMDLPYATGQFDRVFCVSVLEHLKDRCNKFPLLQKLGPISNLVRRDIRDSLTEFKRVLQPNGLIVLTFDYPRINLDYLQAVTRQVGLRFAGPTDFRIPDDAIYYPSKQLYCFRAVLTPQDANISGLTFNLSRAA